jgi:hypothetical protein
LNRCSVMDESFNPLKRDKLRIKSEKLRCELFEGFDHQDINPCVMATK